MADALFRNDLPLDADHVLRLLLARFPQLGEVEVAYLGAGWDFTAFEVNGEWVFRFPKRKGEQARLELERRILPDLAPRLPIPIPIPELFGEPGRDYPWIFAGYRKLPGIQAFSVPVPGHAREALAATLGTFLGSLHAFPPDRVRDAGAFVEPLEEIDEETRREAVETYRIFGGEDRMDGARALLLDPTRRPTLWPHDRVAVHDDLGPEHILTSPAGDRITAVIDWADMGIGDPAVDFAAFGYWLGLPFVRRVLQHYDRPVDGAFLDRVRRGMLGIAADDLRYGDPEERDALFARARRAIDEVLAEEAASDRGSHPTAGA